MCDEMFVKHYINVQSMHEGTNLCITVLGNDHMTESGV